MLNGFALGCSSVKREHQVMLDAARLSVMRFVIDCRDPS